MQHNLHNEQIRKHNDQIKTNDQTKLRPKWIKMV